MSGQTITRHLAVNQTAINGPGKCYNTPVHHEQHHRPPKNTLIYYLLHSEAVSSMHTARPLYGMSNRSMCNFI